MARQRREQDRGELPEPTLVTPTLAEIYLGQGHTAQALALYRRLAADAPEDASLRRKVAVLALRLEREEADAALLRRIDYLKRLLRRIQRRRRKDSGHGIGAGA